MSNHWIGEGTMSRRRMLATSSIGFGATALAGLLANPNQAPAASGLNAQAPHFMPKAKRVIFLFMHGGPSQVDTFDYKPLLQRDHGKPLPFSKPRVVSSETGNLLASPFKFKQYGKSGAWVSELFPHLGQRADELCFIHSMHGSNSRHGGALLELHTGSDTFIRPSMGSWITYGLGSENRDLPGFITICPTLTHGGVNNWSSAFLPAIHQGTPVGTSSVASDQAKIPFIQPFQPGKFQRQELDLLEKMNRAHLAQAGGDAALEGRIEAMELAFRMQTVAPDLQDISKESKATLDLYGLDDPRTANFGRMCLMARRFAERGVRFVQVTHSYKWDQHGNLKADHEKNAREVDKPIAGLIADLKRLGLLEDTLVVFSGEFGRTPVAQGNDGRDHNPHGFTIWLAGGGVKPGFKHGATDDYGYFSVEKRVHFHDLHATLLHLLGLNHKKLTFQYGGRDFRLTDVEGEVVREILV
ncbi:MAG: DUF1501 domain-containing protein [Gemmataceae bacterium]|nr:DUF1501 domain-containing protein [Gemmataceae bacterium]